MKKMKTGTAAGKKGQIFSVDVLLALLPVMMILGASLQYLYLAEEDMKDLSLRSYSDSINHGLSEAVFYDKSAVVVNESDCRDFETLLNRSARKNVLGYVYQARVIDYYDPNTPSLCADPDPAKDLLYSAGLDQFSSLTARNPTSSELRFIVQYNSTKGIKPGRFAGVSISTWKNV